ncbi:MAG: hypothetical protein JWO43_408 [Candidatus Adlerbacteria bacterium]|nr:hypothetical protein [Candidatus Adlerbacteria bacterium]
MHTMHMKVLLTCRECGHRDWGDHERPLINRIKIWNHAKLAHPGLTPDMVKSVMHVSYTYEHEPQPLTEVSILRPATA